MSVKECRLFVRVGFGLGIGIGILIGSLMMVLIR